MPVSLKDHVEQEKYVHEKDEGSYTEIGDDHIKALYQKFQSTKEYSVIFNFLYGDNVSAELGYPLYGGGVLREFLFA